jgi:hypothetical protein
VRLGSVFSGTLYNGVKIFYFVALLSFIVCLSVGLWIIERRFIRFAGYLLPNVKADQLRNCVERGGPSIYFKAVDLSQNFPKETKENVKLSVMIVVLGGGGGRELNSENPEPRISNGRFMQWQKSGVTTQSKIMYLKAK